MVTQQDAIAIVKEFLMEIKSTGLKIDRAILFGSFAKNEQHEYSDIDLALVSEKFQGAGFLDKPLVKIPLRKHFIIEPKFYSTNYFLNQGDAFIDHILKTGIEIKVS